MVCRSALVAVDPSACVLAGLSRPSRLPACGLQRQGQARTSPFLPCFAPPFLQARDVLSSYLSAHLRPLLIRAPHIILHPPLHPLRLSLHLSPPPHHIHPACRCRHPPHCQRRRRGRAVLFSPALILLVASLSTTTPFGAVSAVSVTPWPSARLFSTHPLLLISAAVTLSGSDLLFDTLSTISLFLGFAAYGFFPA